MSTCDCLTVPSTPRKTVLEMAMVVVLVSCVGDGVMRRKCGDVDKGWCEAKGVEKEKYSRSSCE